MRCPVLLFVLDADAEHGRFLGLDNLTSKVSVTETEAIRRPVGNTINSEHLQRLLKELETSRVEMWKMR